MKKYFRLIAVSAFVATLAIYGCKSKTEVEHSEDKVESAEHSGHDHGEEVQSFTVWQDSLEVFVELTEMLGGQETEVLAHVTDLATNRPVGTGSLTLQFMQHDREVQRAEAGSPARPGIFDLDLTAPAAGEYQMVFSLTREGRTQRVVFEDTDVFATEGEAHAGHDHAAHEEGEEHGHDDGEAHAESSGHEGSANGSSEEIVNFLKEQQWQVEFASRPVERRTISDNIRALGEIKAAGVGEAEVFAPFDGVLVPDPQHGIVRPGQQVSKGEVLARVAPSGGPESGWTQLLNDYRLAKAEYERVSRLADEGAVSAKRKEEARLDLENKRSRVRGTLGGLDSDIDEMLAEGEHFHLRAPASGVITDIHLRFGQHVVMGEHLFNIINPSRIWLEVQVPVSESGRLDQVDDATFSLSGSNEIYRVSSLGGRLVTVSTLLDPVTRRVPVIFELNNSNSLFRPGSYAQVYLKTRSSREALAVPESSVLDEDGTSVVYVQVGGEEFARRVVETGAKDEGYVEVISGLNASERVVSIGAYKVRLASLKISAADAGHAGHGH